jgi:hypothetical protein
MLHWSSSCPQRRGREDVLLFEAHLAFSVGAEQWELNPAMLKVNYLAAAGIYARLARTEKRPGHVT